MGAYSLRWADEDLFPELSKHKGNLTKSLTNILSATEGPSGLVGTIASPRSICYLCRPLGKGTRTPQRQWGVSRSPLSGVVGEGVNLWAGNKISTYHNFLQSTLVVKTSNKGFKVYMYNNDRAQAISTVGKDEKNYEWESGL